MSFHQALPDSHLTKLASINERFSRLRSQTGMRLLGRNSIWKVWLASYAIWTFIALTTSVSVYRLNLTYWKTPGTYWDALRLPLINDLIFATLTPLVLLFALRWRVDRTNWKTRLPTHFAGAIVFTASHAVIRMLVYPVVDSMSKQPFPVGWSLFGRLFFYNLPDDCFSIYLPVVIIAHMIAYYQESRSRELRASQLETRLAQAQLRALKSQLQPHFLFNTLHSISTLMMTNVQAADSMLVRLSDLLRLSLENNTVQETTLHREMHFVEGYLEIEKVRFGNRLCVKCDVSPDTLDANVPHLLLQPLVENAIRHGASKRIAGGEVWIAAARENDDVVIEVGDNGPGFSPNPEWNAKHGLGLNATRERLEVFYGARQRLDIISAPGRGTTVRVRLPYHAGTVPVMYELEAIHGLR